MFGGNSRGEKWYVKWKKKTNLKTKKSGELCGTVY